MKWQIFFSTFVLIFLAELGDKTQLAAMARVAASGSARWTIFLAASLALVCSTLLAVLLGDVLTRLAPERYIRMGAAILFILFGLILLRESLVAADKKAPAPIPVSENKPGSLARFIFEQAAAFEKAAWQDYQALATRAADPRTRAILEDLAREESSHLTQVEALAAAHGQIDFAPPAIVAALPETQALLADVGDDRDRPLIEHALEHEQATARFYAELARVTPMPPLKKAFLELAAAEEAHCRRLTLFLKG